MNQTKKRLKIIKLAISITDMETIQLQILKLSPLKTDTKIQEIIAGLQAENYAQTQALITTYIEMPMDEILQRTSQEARQLKKEEERAIIEEFDLFVTTPEKKKEKKKEFFDFSTLTSEDVPRQKQETINFDALLNIEADDILSGNIELDISHTQKDTFFDLPEQHAENTKDSPIDTAFIPKDTFFDEESPVIQELQKEKILHEEETIVPSDEHNKETIQEEPTIIPFEENIPSQYRAIPYIDQKFKNMHTQYPPVQESDENFSSVNTWLLQISNDGYTNDEVEEMIKYITKLTEANNLAEAAQLLLISGATKSKFAQFMLARALYKGEILQKNLPESFTLINRLAMDDDCPEAICDLAQFYEKGIGIDKDKKKAEELYKEAMELGIKRAIDHYERVRKQNSSFFSAFAK
jgi:hypothetical protein